MNKPTLVVMAAGMGSRYGGLKQIDTIDEYGNIIIDFSIYDALKAGFEKIVFIIKKENEKIFKEVIGDRISKIAEVSYVYQDMEDIPCGFKVPEEREKPWGTGHAITSCVGFLNEPFVVINADDYYGKEAFKTAFDFLKNVKDTNIAHYLLIGYKIENTLTDNGFVTRGVCNVDENGYLKSIDERMNIKKIDGDAFFTEDAGKTFIHIPDGTTVSMNMWGFTPSVLNKLENRFAKFLKENLSINPLKAEYILPVAIDDIIRDNEADVKVLECFDKWYGVTYKEDKQTVIDAIRELKDVGIYPEKLWD